VRSFPLGSALAGAAVGGLDAAGGVTGVVPKGRRGAATPNRMRPGDVVVLHAPDHATDTDAARRPSLVVDGTARVTVLRGDGVVLADRDQSGTAQVEPGAAWVVVQCDATVTPSEGLAGWHSRSRVSSLGTGSALAAGCVVTVDNAAAPATVAWCDTAEVTRGADSVLTSFAGDAAAVRSVVVVVESADPEHVEEMALTLAGAARTRDAAGEPVPPTLVVRGTQVAAVYPVDPLPVDHPDGPGSLPGATSVAVGVSTGSTWRLTGVMAGTAEPDAVAAAISRHGIEAATARLLAPAGPGCSVTWAPAKPIRRRRRSR
jgi:hypothetical protein